MTFDASHKVKLAGGHIKAFVRHIARDADEKAGFSFAHANVNIDGELTEFNESFVNDGAGGFRGLHSVDDRAPSDELETYLRARLATVKTRPKKDAVAMRPLILQLDPKWFADHNPDWRENGLNDAARRYTAESLQWAINEFGPANVIGGSLHLDEVNPQLHVLVTPVTTDGRLSQKDFFRGPSDLKRQRKELLEAMEVAGYDVEHRVTRRSKEHLGSAEYQAKADQAKRVSALLAVAETDGKNAWDDRQAAKAELAAARGEAHGIRRRARDDGAKTGYAEGERLGFDAGMRTSTQTIERRVAENVRQLREDLECELLAAERARVALRDGLIFVRARLDAFDRLTTEVDEGTRVVDPRAIDRVTAALREVRDEKRAIYERFPELRQPGHGDESDHNALGIQYEQ